MKSPGRASEIRAKYGTAAVSKNSKAALNTVSHVIQLISFWQRIISWKKCIYF